MNKICICLLAVFALIACDKTTYDLTGKWQAEEIQYANGTVSYPDSIFYNFQSTLFTYQVLNAASTGTSQYPGFRRMIDDDTMELEFAESSEFGRTPEQSARVAGWNDVKRVFKIEKLTHKKLILSSEGDTFIFHNF